MGRRTAPNRTERALFLAKCSLNLICIRDTRLNLGIGWSRGRPDSKGIAMHLKRSITFSAAMALAMAPVVAQAGQVASPASRLSLTPVVAAHQVKRAQAPMTRTSQLSRGAGVGVVLAAFAGGLLILYLIAETNDPDTP